MHSQYGEHRRSDVSAADAAGILGLVVLALCIVVYAHIAAARSARDLDRNSMINPSLPAERTITIRADLDPAAAGGHTHPHVGQ